MQRIRSGDKVIVIAGKEKGRQGIVKKVLGSKLTIEGLNLAKKHVKPNPNIQETGGVKHIERPLDCSNVAIYNPKTEKGDKVGFKFIEQEGKQVKVRYYKSTNDIIEAV